MLAEFKLKNGKVNPQACIEQIGLVLAVYKELINITREYLNDTKGGEIKRWFTDVRSTDASYVIIKDDNRWFVIIMGTVNFSQIWNHVRGATGELVVPVEGAFNPDIFEHAYFKKIAEQVLTALDEQVGDYTGQRFFLSGHSLGCAAADILGQRLSDKVGSSNVQVMGFGSPRGTTLDDPRKRAGSSVNWSNENDVITNMPPKYFDAVGKIKALIKGGWGRLAALHLWNHYSETHTLDENSNVTISFVDDKPSVWNPVNYYDSFEAEHKSDTYCSRILTWYEKNRLTVADARTLAFIAQVRALGDRQDYPDTFKKSSYLDANDVNNWWFGNLLPKITSTQLDTTESVNLSVGAVIRRLTHNILSLGGDTIAISHYIGTLYEGNGTWGVSHRVAMKSGLSESAAKTLMTDLSYNHSMCFGNNVTPKENPTVKNLACPVFEWLRLSSAIAPDEGNLFRLSANLNGGYRGKTGNGADHFGNALKIRLRSQCVDTPTKFSHSTLTIVGFVDSVVKNGEYDPSVQITDTQTFGGVLKDYLDFLIAGGNFGHMAPDPTKDYKKSTVIVADSGNDLVKLTIPAHGYVQGYKVKLTGGNRRALRKNWLINVVDANTITLQDSATLSDDLPTTQVRVRPICDENNNKMLKFFKFVSYSDAVKISAHKPGQQFLGVSFRKRQRD